MSRRPHTGHRRVLTRLLAVFATLAAVSCGRASPASPSTGSNVSGTWQATLSQPNGTISFVVSPDQRVTSISISYTINGCVANASNSTLSIPIPAATPTFEWAFGNSLDTNLLVIEGTFVSTAAVSGLLNITNFNGCGSANVFWIATKH